MQWKPTLSGLVLSLLAAASHAATTQAELHLTDVQWSLEDLDPGDGIDPSVNWDHRFSNLAVYVRSLGNFEQDGANGQDWGDYGVSLKGTSSWVTGNELHILSDASERSLALVRDDSSRSGDFILGPRSQISLSGHVDAKMTGSGQFNVNDVWGGISLYASVSGLVFDNVSLIESGRISKSLSVVLRNESDEPLNASMSWGGGVYFDERGVVPEPHALMMLLAGAGVVVQTGRNGRRQV